MIYTYKCAKCGEFEIRLKVAELPLTHCPKCEGGEIERVYKPISAVYKCGGFYSKDNQK
jgi:putative FmdB family regulatory protein